MDDLPAHLLLEILSRLSDSADIARCRVASKALNSVAPEIRSVHLYCSHLRYAKSRSPLTRSSITPFKQVFCKLISELQIVERVSVGVEKPLRLVSYDDVEDEDDDLFFSEVDFVKTWLPGVCRDLKSISISDFWVQSCWRRTDVLSLISSYCLQLLELEVKNAWLSVDGLTPMPNLRALTLEFIRLDDENLEKSYLKVYGPLHKGEMEMGAVERGNKRHLDIRLNCEINGFPKLLYVAVKIG